MTRDIIYSIRTYYKTAISIIFLSLILWQTLKPTGGRVVSTEVNVVLGIEVAACVAMFTCLIQIFIKRQNSSHMHLGWSDTFVWFWLIYYCCNAWFWTDTPCATTALKGVMMFLTYFTLRLLFSFYCISKKILILELLLFCGYEALLGITQLVGGSSNHLLFLITGTFYNPGPYSAYLVLGAVILLSMLHLEKQSMYLFECKTIKTEYFYNGLLFLILLILPATWSRSAFVALVVMCLWIFRNKYHKYRYFLWGAIVMAVIALYFVKKGSADGRLIIWLSSLTSWKHSPLIGTGIGSFFHAEAEGTAELFSEKGYIQAFNSADVTNFMCNDYLQILLEQGIIGALLCALAACAMLSKLHGQSKSLCYGVIALFVFSLTSYPFDLLPYKLIVVLIAAWANSQPEETIDNHVIRRIIRMPLHPFGWKSYWVMAIVIFMSSVFLEKEMNKRLDAERSYYLFCNTGQEAFIDDYYDLLPMEQDNQSFLFDFGKLLRSFNRYNDSNAILQKGTLVSNDPMFYVLMGNNYKDMKCFDLSETAYKKAFNVMPNRLYPLYQLMLLYQQEGRREYMLQMAQRVVSFPEKVTSPATEEMKKKAKDILLTKSFGEYQ